MVVPFGCGKKQPKCLHKKCCTLVTLIHNWHEGSSDFLVFGPGFLKWIRSFMFNLIIVPGVVSTFSLWLFSVRSYSFFFLFLISLLYSVTLWHKWFWTKPDPSALSGMFERILHLLPFLFDAILFEEAPHLNDVMELTLRHRVWAHALLSAADAFVPVTIYCYAC